VSAATTVLSERAVPFVTAKTWTTDGVYREAAARTAGRRDEGCLALEMKAAARVAVARFRGVPLVWLLYAATHWPARPGTIATGRPTNAARSCSG
jgi:uridine phosphorylase